MRRRSTAVAKYCGSRPGARARISQGAARITAAAMSRETQTKTRVSLRKRAVRSAPCRGGEHGDEGKDDAVDQDGVERVERAHGDGQGIGMAVGAEQVGDSARGAKPRRCR